MELSNLDLTIQKSTLVSTEMHDFGKDIFFSCWKLFRILSLLTLLTRMREGVQLANQRSLRGHPTAPPTTETSADAASPRRLASVQVATAKRQQRANQQ